MLFYNLLQSEMLRGLQTKQGGNKESNYLHSKIQEFGGCPLAPGEQSRGSHSGYTLESPGDLSLPADEGFSLG